MGMPTMMPKTFAAPPVVALGVSAREPKVMMISPSDETRYKLALDEIMSDLLSKYEAFSARNKSLGLPSTSVLRDSIDRCKSFSEWSVFVSNLIANVSDDDARLRILSFVKPSTLRGITKAVVYAPSDLVAFLTNARVQNLHSRGDS